MHRTLLTTAALAATVSASSGLVAPGHMAHMNQIQARQTMDGMDGMSGSGDVQPTACVSELMNAYSTFPTPPPQLSSYAVESPITDPCSFSIPESLSSVVLSYETEVLSWYSTQSAAIESTLAQSQCSSYQAQASSYLGEMCTAPVVSGMQGTTTVDGTAAATSMAGMGGDGMNMTGMTMAMTPTVSATGSPASSAMSAGGSRETGMVAAAAVGLIGVLAAL